MEAINEVFCKIYVLFFILYVVVFKFYFIYIFLLICVTGSNQYIIHIMWERCSGFYMLDLCNFKFFYIHIINLSWVEILYYSKNYIISKKKIRENLIYQFHSVIRTNVLPIQEQNSYHWTEIRQIVLNVVVE